MLKKKNFNCKKTIAIKNQLDDFDLTEPIACFVCGTRHFPDEKTFLTIYGNVCVGFYGGLIGNNFTEHGELGRIDFICHKESCVLKAFSIETIRTRS